MATDKFLIAPLQSGLQTNLEPWLLMDDAFQQLENAYIWRGRLRKRPGAYPMVPSRASAEQQLFSRLRINIGTTDGAGDFTAATAPPGPKVVPGIKFNVGQIFSVGVEIFTVFQVGVPAAMKTTGAATLATFNTTTGEVILNGAAAATDVYFYPADPVMDFAVYNRLLVNDENLYAFDTQFSYVFRKATGWIRLGTAVWTGTDSAFYHVSNYRGALESDFLLFVVNNVVADQIKYWDGATWTSFSPIYNLASGFVIRTAKLVVSFKGRLLLLNTTEQTAAGNAIFTNRIRYSQRGTPVAVDSWYEDDHGKGGYVDIESKEAIISAGFFKDRLILFLERSTWELVYTGNIIDPFRVQRIDSELGVESTDSIIMMDKAVLGFGSNGIHACNGNNVERIDEKIPNTIFDVSNQNESLKRVSGIRDFFSESIYWSFTSSAKTSAYSDIYPNRVLLYNYPTASWAILDDSITAFGYYQNEGVLTWADLTIPWESNNYSWGDPLLHDLFRNVVAGNQEGFTFLINNEVASNSISLSITQITVVANMVTLTIINHNLAPNSYIYIENCSGAGTITALNDRIFRVHDIPSVDTIRIDESAIAGVYYGGGTITLVSNLNIVSKRYNLYVDKAKRINVPRIDFLLGTTEGGQVSFDFSTSFSFELLIEKGNITNSSLGSNALESIPYNDAEINQDKLWRSVYILAEGDVIQYQLSLNDDQITDPSIAFSTFSLHGIIIHARPISEL